MDFIDIFAGCGGMGEGFIDAGFAPAAFVEMDGHACNTLRTRNAYHSLKKSGMLGIYRSYQKGHITRDELYRHADPLARCKVICEEIAGGRIDRIFDAVHNALNGGGLGVLLGCPPCQAYSVANHTNDKSDKRLFLYEYFALFLKEFAPKMFVFENVPGLLSIDGGRIFADIQACFNTLGYGTVHKIVNANKYGVLQSRKRLIIIGTKKGGSLLGHSVFDRMPQTNNLSYTVNDVLCDLAPMPHGSVGTGYSKDANRYLSAHNIRTPNCVLTNHRSRRHNADDLGVFEYMANQLLLYGKKPKHNQIPKSLYSGRKGSFFDRFKVVDGKMPYAHTITAHIAKDGQHYIHPDVNQNRSLTVREAARIQSFPDSYHFEGPVGAQFKQVGNAVPPLLSKAIAFAMKVILDVNH